MSKYLKLIQFFKTKQMGDNHLCDMLIVIRLQINRRHENKSRNKREKVSILRFSDSSLNTNTKL